MIYPTISEYIESIKYAEDNFANLTNLRPELDDDGRPIMSSGNFAVVFKMKDQITGKLKAVKCFLREQEGREEAYRMISEELKYVSSHFLTPIKYLYNELFVDSSSTNKTDFPVLVMDWVEGITLDKYIRNHLNDQYELSMLAYQFSRLAMWLLPQPFAHGDLKPDNILVRDDGTLVLVDYDGMYVPAMKGQKARELGSPDFRHPARTIDCFNEHIDDLSLAAIAMQLAAIAQDSGLFENQKDDILLLTEKDHCDLINSSNHKLLHSLLRSPNFEILYALYHLAHANHTLSNVCFRAFQFPKPEKNDAVKLSSEVSDEDLKNGIRDEFGALYSPDGLQLLKGANMSQYRIRQGTKFVCDSAFWRHESLTSISIPSSVTHIGNTAFSMCENLSSITIPNSVKHIGDYAFYGCASLSSIALPNSVTYVGANPFHNSGVSKIECNNSFYEVDKHALYSKGKKTIIAFFDKGISEFTIPNSVTHIGDTAFYGCTGLSSIIIPNTIKHIVFEAFSMCKKLSSITIPDSVTQIGNEAFYGCVSLSSITIPDSVTHIGNSAFYGCTSLHSITIPDSVRHIGDYVFSQCETLAFIIIPRGSRAKFEKLLSNELYDKIIEQ